MSPLAPRLALKATVLYIFLLAFFRPPLFLFVAGSIFGRRLADVAFLASSPLAATLSSAPTPLPPFRRLPAHPRCADRHRRLLFCCAGGAPSVTVLRALFKPAPLSPPFRGFLFPARLHPLRGRGLSCRGPRRCFALAWPPCRPCAAVIIHTRGFYPTPSSRVWACDSTSLWGGTQGKLESSGCCLDLRFLSRRFLFLPSSLSSRYCWLFSGDESLPSPSF